MKLLGNKLLVSPISTFKAPGPIVVPDSVKDHYAFAGPKLFRVLEVGTGRVNRKGIRIPIEVSPGDRVLCQSYTTGPKEFGDGRLIITDDQILAVLPRIP